MIWAGEHGYVGLRKISGDQLPFPDPATYITQLLDAHLGE
jgi:hypothetical protein